MYLSQRGCAVAGPMISLFAKIVGYAFIIMGLVWILQGVNILPGSFMTGQIVWAWRGRSCWPG